MESSRQPDSILPATVILLVLLVGGYLGFQTPLNSSRPDGTDIENAGNMEEGKVRARLWEDPLAAIHKSGKTKVSQAPFLLADQRPLTVLFVMIPGGPYPEDTEQRLRTRYAVLSALDLAGFVPSDGQYIGYARFAHEEPLLEHGQPLVVPFERLDPDTRTHGANARSILVVWLNDEFFSTDALWHLSNLKNSLASHSQSEASETDVSFALIGPTNSNGLMKMVRQSEATVCASQMDGTAELMPVPIYSPWATIDDQELIEELYSRPGTKNLDGECISHINGEDGTQAIIEASLGAKWKLHRMNTTDRKLADSLKSELSIRGVDLKKPGQHMVLISEWDTDYGRAIPEAFKKEICGQDTSNNGSVRCSDRIKRFSYLRGLDGKLPRKSPNGNNHKEGDDKNRKKEEKLSSPGDVERSEGQSQFDYARRLGTRITELQRELWREGKSLKAIGILGTDVHDKLLLLQALRRKFPGIIFFTTDLDARLLHPEEIKWTRNLVIASGFGLHLHPEIQERIPPFRDTYQTAIFYSVLSAVNYPKLQGRIPSEGLTPRLYEIGRKGAVDLSSESCGHNLHPRREDLFAFLSCSKDLTEFFSIWYITVFLGVALLALAGMLVLRNGGPRARQVMWIAAMTIAIFACLVSWEILPTYDWARGEPFSVFDGVSIWPTEVIRFLVGLFCVYCLLRSWDQLNSNTQQLSANYNFGLSNEWPAVTDWKQIFWASATSELKKASHISELWRFYVRQGSGSYRAVRIFRGVACLSLLWLFLQGFFGRPFVPYRGNFSYIVDQMVIFLSGFSLIVLMYFIIDAVNLCTTFVQELTRLRWNSRETASTPVDAWTTIGLIGDRTSAVGNLIYFPFVALFLLIASRLFYFDAWDFPLSLIIVLVVWLPLQLVVAALLLRRAAREARSAALQQLGDKLWKAESKTAEEIKQATSRIESSQQGAFVPMSRDPVVSFILPSGSLGVLALLEYMVGIF